MYNVGDFVRVKENANKIHGRGVLWTSSMDEYLGNEYEIHGIAQKDYYMLEGCHIGNGDNVTEYYWFDPEWIELVKRSFDYFIDENELINLVTENG